MSKKKKSGAFRRRVQLRVEGVKWIELGVTAIIGHAHGTPCFTCAMAAAPPSRFTYASRLSAPWPFWVYGIHLSRCVNLVAVSLVNLILLVLFFILDI